MPLAPGGKPLVLTLILFLVATIPGAPGVGLETRASTASMTAAIGYPLLAGLLPLVAIVTAWKWPRASAWCAIVAAVGTILLNILDITHVLQPLAPPTAVAIDEAVVCLVGVAVAWLAWRVLKSPAT